MEFRKAADYRRGDGSPRGRRNRAAGKEDVTDRDIGKAGGRSAPVGDDHPPICVVHAREIASAGNVIDSTAAENDVRRSLRTLVIVAFAEDIDGGRDGG